MHFSRALGREVEFVILSEQIPLARASSAIDALRDAQKMCAVTKVGTVLNYLSLVSLSFPEPTIPLASGRKCRLIYFRFYCAAEILHFISIAVACYNCAHFLLLRFIVLIAIGRENAKSGKSKEI